MLNTPFRRRPLIEELEPRVLFSADLAPLALDGLPPAPEQRVLDAQGEFVSAAAVSRTAHELVVIDSRVDGLDALLADIHAQAGAGRNIDVVVLDPDRDGVAQIGRALQDRGQIDALHIISHGESGQLLLGSSAIDSASLDAQAAAFRAWGSALSADADILLYGCDVAAGEMGRQFVQTLASLTGADVAASDNATGAAARGGDWVLEQSTGGIEAALAVGAAAQQDWGGLLGDEFMVNTTIDNQQTTAALSRGSQQAVAYDAAGNFVVVWTSKNQDGGSNTDGVYARRFAGDGTPLTGEIQLNTTVLGNQNQARVVSDAAGNFVATWTSEAKDGNLTAVVVRHFAADGTPLTGEILVNTTTLGAQSNSTIGMNPATGAFVVAWQGRGVGDTDGVFFRRFAANGTALDASERRANLTNAGVEQNPAVAMDASGRFVVAYDVGNHVYFQRFAASGGALDGRVAVAPDFVDTTGAAIAMDGAGNFTLVYRDSTLQGVWGHGYYANGSERYVNFAVDFGLSNDATSPSIAMAGDGAFIVTYQKAGTSGFDIFARKYQASGSPSGSAFAVNQATSGGQVAPSIALLDSERYVVVWSGQAAVDAQAVSARIYGAPASPPVITSNGGGAAASVLIAENTTAVTTVTATDPDPGATLSYSIAGGADAARFTIDSMTGVLRFAMPPNYESPTDAGGDNVYDVTVRVSDGVLADSQAIRVFVFDVNEAPLAQADAYAMSWNSVLTVSAAGGLLANDTDPEHAPLTASLIAGPGNGSLALNPDGSFSYTPTPGWSGTDTFTYKARDGAFDSSVVSVTITVNVANVAPATTPVALAPINENSGPRLIAQAELLANASDANGDSLTATGLAVSAGAGLLAYNGDGAWTYTPAPNDDTSVSFSYTITDGSLAAPGSASLDIVPTPIATDDTAATDEDTPVILDVLANDSDPDGGALAVLSVSPGANGSVTFTGLNVTYTPAPDFYGLDSFTYTIRNGNGGSATATVNVNVNPVHDAPVGLPAISGTAAEDQTLTADTSGISDVDGLGAFSYQWLRNNVPVGGATAPTYVLGDADVGSRFSVQVSYIDGEGAAKNLVSGQTAPVLNVNDAPVAADAAYSASEDTPLAGALPIASDAEGDTIAYSLNSAPIWGAVMVNPTGGFSYTPHANFNGSDSFSYTVADGNGGSNTYTVTLNIVPVNDAPTLTINTMTLNAGEFRVLGSADLQAADVDNIASELTFVLTGVPSQGTLALNGVPLVLNGSFTQADIDSGRVSYTNTSASAAAEGFSLKVIDAGGAETSGVLAIVISLPVESPAEAGAPMASLTPAAKTVASVNEPPPPDSPAPVVSHVALAESPAEASSSTDGMVGMQANEDAVLTTAYRSAGQSNPVEAVRIPALPKTDGAPAEPLMVPFNPALNAIASDANALRMLQASLGNNSFQLQLNQLQDEIRQQLSLDKNTVASSLVVSTGLSVGYVLWLVRGGVLLSSLLTSLPAWRLIDPLPILGHLSRTKRSDDEDDSLEGMLKKSNAESRTDASTTEGNTP